MFCQNGLDAVVTTAVRAGAVIDGTGRDPLRLAWVIIEDGRIERVASERPRDADAIDVSELTILPGLIDSHVHLGISAAPTWCRRSPHCHGRAVRLRQIRLPCQAT